MHGHSGESTVAFDFPAWKHDDSEPWAKQFLLLQREGEFCFLFHKLKKQCSPWGLSIFLTDELKKCFSCIDLLYLLNMRMWIRVTLMREQQSVRNEQAFLCMLESEVFIRLLCIFLCCKIQNKRGAKVCYPVYWELRRLLTKPRCLAHSGGSGQALLSGCNAHKRPVPSHGADYESVNFRRLWSCSLKFKSCLFIPAMFRRARRELWVLHNALLVQWRQVAPS